MKAAIILLRRFLRRRPQLAVGLALTATLMAVALLSRVWTPSPSTRLDVAHRLAAPLARGLLGTDQLGRDVLSQLMVGAWNSLATAVTAVALGGGVGTVVGIVAAARRGLVEAVAMRASDVVFAMPPILSAMMLGAFLGPGAATATIAIAVFMVPVFARLALSSARQAWTRDYALASRAAGKGRARISFEHILPNIAGPLIVQASVQLGLAILTEAGLSFLGLGLPPPAPSWGRMLADAQTYLGAAPWLAVAPGLAIALAVFGFNLVGDGLHDLLDPEREDGR